MKRLLHILPPNSHILYGYACYTIIRTKFREKCRHFSCGILIIYTVNNITVSVKVTAECIAVCNPFVKVCAGIPGFITYVIKINIIFKAEILAFAFDSRFIKLIAVLNKIRIILGSVTARILYGGYIKVRRSVPQVIDRRACTRCRSLGGYNRICCRYNGIACKGRDKNNRN